MAAASMILRGSSSNVVRLACTSVAALALPPVLTRVLPNDVYSAWVTLLQVSTYVALLDLGLQTVVARFVAEHHAKGEFERAAIVLSTAIRLLVVGALLGGALVALAVVAVPSLFPEMPAALHPEARLSLLIVGLSSAVTLPFGPFMSSFIGLQRYGFPTVITVGSRLLQTAMLVLAAVSGGGLVAMAAAVAGVNILTAFAQYVGWKRLALPELGSRVGRPDRLTARLLLSTGSVLALWMLGGLFVNGLDTVIVGHFDFRSAGTFAVAVVVVNFLVSVIAGLFGPLMPAAAALHGPDAARDAAAMTLRFTRYGTLVVVGLTVSLCVAAYPLLVIWVGPAYAEAGASFLRLLLLGQAIRHLGYTYSLVVVGRGQHRPATLATVSEAVVNLTVSVALAEVLGAAGVAIGTIIGAAVSVALHLAVSMRFTGAAIPVTRAALGFGGVIKPALTYSPMLCLLVSFDGTSIVPTPPIVLVIAGGATIAVIAMFGITSREREVILQAVKRVLRRMGRSEHAY